MLSKNSLELADTHLLGIRNFGLLRFLCIVLHGTELGILLVQLTNANVISRLWIGSTLGNLNMETIFG